MHAGSGIVGTLTPQGRKNYLALCHFASAISLMASPDALLGKRECRGPLA